MTPPDKTSSSLSLILIKDSLISLTVLGDHTLLKDHPMSFPQTEKDAQKLAVIKLKITKERDKVLFKLREIDPKNNGNENEIIISIKNVGRIRDLCALFIKSSNNPK
jgi:hypothetical protein